jgi:hypothetical protein
MKKLFSAVCLLVAVVWIATTIRAAETNAPADFTIGTYVVASSPERFGTNLREPFDYNNYTFDAGFEPVTIRRQHTATGGGSNYVENVSGATTSHYRIMADGFFDGATVRVYRPSNNGGPLQFVRSGTITNYVTDGFRRLHILPVTTNQYVDATAAPGVSYEYQVRAVNTSSLVSSNYSGGASNAGLVAAAALAGSTSATNPAWTNSFFNRNNPAPAIPASVTATPLAGAVQLNWTANVETDLAGYYVYRRTVGAPQYRILLDSNSAPTQSNDIYFIEMTSVNPPTWRMHDRLGALVLNDQWTFTAGPNWPYGYPGAIARDGSTVCPTNGGLSSLRLDNPGTHQITISQAAFANPNFYGGYYPALSSGVTYRVEVWLKQTNVPSAQVRFALTQQYAAISNAWSVTGSWRKYSHLFTAPAMATNATISSITLAFNGPGTVWADNFLLYEDADGDPATYPPFTLRPAAAQALADYRPGPLRPQTGTSTGRWGVSMDDWLTEEPSIQPQWAGDNGRARPDDPYKLPMFLRMARDCGGDPWLCVGNFMSEQEWLNLMEYLAAPYTPGTDTPATKPYAYLRYTQGQTAPWTDLFPRLYIEYADELWNGMFQWNFANGNVCGQFSEYFFNVAKSSPYYAAVSNRFQYIVDGWMISTDPTNSYGHAASLASPGSQYNDVATYIGGWEAGIAAGGTNVNDEGFQGYMMYPATFIKPFIDRQAAARAFNAAAGHPYGIALYEGGPGFANPSPGSPYDPLSETYGKSLAAGVATLDTYLYDSLKGVDPQCFFSFGGQYNWASHGLPSFGYYPQPCWLALQMRNRYASGAMLATAFNSAPTLDVPAWANTNGVVQMPATPNVPLVVPYAFRTGTTYSVFVLSRKINGDTPVTLRLPFNSVTNTTLYKLTGDPRLSNSTNLNITITPQTIVGFTQNFSFTMPPGSAYLYVFEGANTLTPPAQPTVTISRALGQPAYTTIPAAQFMVNFSEPVTGFTASDVLISGANAAIVADTGPITGMTYTVTVTGMTNSTVVTISVPGGAANSIATGLANLPASATDNGVTYTVPPPLNRLLAYDDFNLAPTNAPYPPFLHTVNTGANWSGSWQVQNFSATNYPDGYKLATNSLTYLNLRTTGSQAIGGRNYEIATRALNAAAFGQFTVIGANPACIGQDNTTLWLSLLLRKDTNDDAPVRLELVNADGVSEYARGDFSVGYFSTQSNSNNVRYWSMAIMRDYSNPNSPIIDYIRSNVAITNGQPALLVVKMQFGDTDRFDLFVNPPSLGGTEPATPNATYTTQSGAINIRFRTARFRAGLGLGYFNGDGLNKGALDELRFGDTYAAVTPVTGLGAAQFTADNLNVNENAGSVTLYIARNTGSSGALTAACWTADNTAFAGANYTAANGAMTWPDGDASLRSLTVPILNDNLAGPNKTFRVLLDTPATSTVTIVESPFNAWCYTRFAGNANTPAIAGKGADPDGDGAVNLLEYALDMNPTVASVVGLPLVSRLTANGETYLTITANKNPNATDIQYSAEVSADLHNWSNDVTILQNDTATFTARDNVPISATPRRFIRLRITAP